MKRFAALMIFLVLVLALSIALAQRVECPVGGFSVTMPDHFAEQPLDAGAPDLCFYWKGKKLTVQAYVTEMGEYSFSDLFQVMTGNETESMSVTVNRMNMYYCAGTDSGGAYVMYSWADRGNYVAMYFYYPENDPTVLKTVDSIMNSIAFDAGH